MPMSAMNKSRVTPTEVMTIDVDIQYATDHSDLPATDKIQKWVRAALHDLADNAELTVRIVDEAESTQLNEQWRKSSGPTNVLSFPYDGEEKYAPGLLGDIVICAPVIFREANDQGKSPDAHWAHMLIHGILHLLDYEHAEPKDADKMEALEIKILKELGYADPYIPVNNK